ncbi:bifunctional adenosylcobinamide kinase/adenosylcobinamide-phosphate guanylyltransferase [Sandaracinus amylolyticus]|nr:bifunctional adenosylcobinamide kinase/adenosylcobinamide-phosphate guanylyltransferase [Sandaracinus amylolyticus]
MSGGRIVLVGGGARSGKSSFALRLARERGERRVFVATAKVTDDDMAARIRRHREERPDFRTIEEPIALASAVRTITDADVVVIDCMTFFVSSLMLAGHDGDAILAHVDALVAALRDAPFTSILVTNEVGMSVHPPTELGRRFQDYAGWCNQRLSRAADEVHLAVIGTILRVRPSPVEAM